METEKAKTLKYRLFGIPDTFYEFVDKTRKQGLASVDIAIENNYQDWGISYDAVILRVGKTRFKFSEHQVAIAGFLERSSALENALKASRQLKEAGLASTICGKALSEVSIGHLKTA